MTQAPSGQFVMPTATPGSLYKRFKALKTAAIAKLNERINALEIEIVNGRFILNNLVADGYLSVQICKETFNEIDKASDTFNPRLRRGLEQRLRAKHRVRDVTVEQTVDGLYRVLLNFHQ